MEKNKLKQYESLLIEREELDKKCLFIHYNFMRIFGNLLVKEYELQIENIKYKKMISYCNRMVNNDKKIIKSELDNYIQDIMLSYEDDLNDLINKNTLAHKKHSSVTENEFSRIKNLYRMIVHMIHPDLHPEYQSIEGVNELWNNAVISYKSNDLKGLIKVYDRLILLLKNNEEIKIDDIDNKIKELNKEIDLMKITEPYIFNKYLRNKRKAKELTDQLNASIRDYKINLKKLKNKLNKFDVIKDNEA